MKFRNKWLQIDKQAWHSSLAGCRVIVYQQFDETLSLGFGAHLLGRYRADGQSLKEEKSITTDKKQRAVLAAQSKHQTGHLTC